MKSILLASASTLVLSGAAFAEAHSEDGVSFSGEATLGYNDDSYGDHDGFYWDTSIDVTLSQTLDNGLTAGATFGFDIIEDGGTADFDADDWVLFLESDTAGLFFGDTAFAAETLWASAGDMESDSFSEADGETVLRGEVMFGSVEAAVSYAILDANGNTGVDDLTQLSVGISADFGAYNAILAYQEDSGDNFNAANGDFNDDEVLGLSFGGSVAGADFRLAYADDSGADSIGVEVAYPFGPVTATVYYVSESAGNDNYGLNVAYEDGPISVELDYANEQGVEKIGLEGSYDVGNGLVVYAGYLTRDDALDDALYVGGEYDLGGGASVLVSYGDTTDDMYYEDEIGAQEYQSGLTVEASFEF